MSMDLGGAKGGVKSDINVTPMVDVMLVLLIIMMLIAPMLQQGVDLRLPQAANSVDKPETSGQTVLSITNDRRFYVNSVQVAETEILVRIQRALEETRERIVLIKGDEDATYGSIMTVMDELRRVGIEDVGLIVDRRLRAGIGGDQ
ncbi:MAG: biopolymer transporter ExbD [Acidobacteriota bacterium]|nr:biopolymer transporter ExbD [Acidobacteriota bacterium]